MRGLEILGAVWGANLAIAMDSADDVNPGWQAKRPDLAILMYREKLQWEDALRVAENFQPARVPEIHCDLAEFMQR